MSRTTYVWDPQQQKVVPAAEDHPQKADTAFMLMGDIKPFTTLDGLEITSRSQLREYEIRNGVRQIGNDWVGTKPSWWDRNRHRIVR